VDVRTDQSTLPYLPLLPPAPPIPPGLHCEQCTRRIRHGGDVQQPRLPLCDSCRRMCDFVGHTHCNDASHMHGVSPCCHHQCADCLALAVNAGSNMYQMCSNYVHQAASSPQSDSHRRTFRLFTCCCCE